MLNSELIARLQEYDPDIEVTILDGFNGGGQPRCINLGPQIWTMDDLCVLKERGMEPDYGDLDTEKGTPIICMGYGCY